MLGAKRTLPKPFALSELKAAVADVLGDEAIYFFIASDAAAPQAPAPVTSSSGTRLIVLAALIDVLRSRRKS